MIINLEKALGIKGSRSEGRKLQTRRCRKTQNSACCLYRDGHMTPSRNPQGFGFQTPKLSCLPWGPWRKIKQALTPLAQQPVVIHMFKLRACLPTEAGFHVCVHKQNQPTNQ